MPLDLRMKQPQVPPGCPFPKILLWDFTKPTDPSWGTERDLRVRYRTPYPKRFEVQTHHILRFIDQPGNEHHGRVYYQLMEVFKGPLAEPMLRSLVIMPEVRGEAKWKQTLEYAVANMHSAVFARCERMLHQDDIESQLWKLANYYKEYHEKLEQKLRELDDERLFEEMAAIYLNLDDSDSDGARLRGSEDDTVCKA